MYVAIEGIDTSGKSTQMNILKKNLSDSKFVFTCEPSLTKLGKKLRDILLHHKIKSNKSEFFLFLSDRSEHIKQTIRPALKKNKTIISDRSLISGVAYSKAFGFTQLIKLNLLATENLIPNKVVILQLDKDELKQRLSHKKKDKIEKRGIKYLLEIQDKTIKCAKKLNIDYKIIDASLKREEVTKIIKAFINE